MADLPLDQRTLLRTLLHKEEVTCRQAQFTAACEAAEERCPGFNVLIQYGVAYMDSDVASDGSTREAQRAPVGSVSPPTSDTDDANSMYTTTTWVSSDVQSV